MHKTQHVDKDRVIPIGPKAQGLLLKYMDGRPSDYCFCPADSEASRLAARNAARKAPLSCGNLPGSNRKKSPQRSPGDRYETASYRRAISRACDKAFPHPTLGQMRRGELTREQVGELRQWQREHRWAPNRLRHTFATKVRAHYGREAAQVVLGHSGANVTQLYAERDLRKGVEVARMMG